MDGSERVDGSEQRNEQGIVPPSGALSKDREAMEGRKDEHEQMARNKAMAKRPLENTRLEGGRAVASSSSESEDEEVHPRCHQRLSPSLQHVAAPPRVDSYASLEKKFELQQKELELQQKELELQRKQIAFLNNDRLHQHTEHQFTQEQNERLFRIMKSINPDIETGPFEELPASIPPDPREPQPRPMNFTQLSELKSRLEATNRTATVL
jgi:hypothetical protein